MKINIPCCIATKEIPDQVTFDKVFSLLEEAGGIVHEDCNYSEYETFQWLGIEKDDNDIYLFDSQSSFSERCDASEVTVYSLEDLLGKQPDSGEWIEWTGGAQPVADGTMVGVKYRNGAESIVTAGLYSQDADFKRISGTLLAADWSYSKDVPTDIAAYKIYKEPSSLSKSTLSGETEKSSTLVSPEGENAIMQEIDSKKLTAGDKVRVVYSEDNFWYRVGEEYTVHCVTVEIDHVTQDTVLAITTQEDIDVGRKVGDCWIRASDVEPCVGEYIAKVGDESGYGANAKVQIELRLGSHNESLVISRDNAYKIYKDLKRIFKKEIS